MGVTMFLQMRMNPTPPDPTQAMLFTWMPVVFTFMLASFPAGLVIYWAWNNTLSILQQGIIMKRQGVKVELFDNLKSLFFEETETGGIEHFRDKRVTVFVRKRAVNALERFIESVKRSDRQVLSHGSLGATRSGAFLLGPTACFL